MTAGSPKMSATDSITSVDKKLTTEGVVDGHKPTVTTEEVDVAARLVSGHEVAFTAEEAARIR